MLRELHISNLALIEALHIEFDAGLSVLTGETGAGKSIVLQAIHLLSGGKAATTWVRAGAEEARIEALFEIPAHRTDLRQRLAEMGFATDEELTLKRLVAASGKSRFYVNDSLATARAAGEIAENLLSVASQHDHQQLLDSRHHLEVIDTVGDLWPARTALAASHGRWRALRDEYLDLQQQERDKEQRRDFLTYQCREIAAANLAVDEEESLKREKDRLKGADTLLRLGHEARHLLADTVANAMAVVRGNLERMAAADQGLAGLAEALAGHAFELEDKAAELRDYLDELANDPARLEEVTARIDLIQQLKRKYGDTVPEVIAYGEKAEQELAALEAMDERLAQLGRETKKIGETLAGEAAALNQARRQAASRLAAAVSGELESLRFEQARFEVRFNDAEADHTLEALTPHGWDRPEFLFSANPGEPVKPLAKIASGGELSRLTLAIKCLLARDDRVGTVIFDEVDAGISGKAAEAVARKIRQLSGHHQVLCITHLPPIAALADQHFTVSKAVTDQRTRTSISRLAGEERVAELARMLAGESITDKTMAYAREMLGKN